MSDEAEKAAEAHVKSLRETYPEIYPTDLERARSNFLAGYAAAMQWRPIESYPKGEAYGSFLVRRPGNGAAKILVQQVSRFEGNLYPDSLGPAVDWTDRVIDATGWLPLPPSE